jgi:MFS family permease
MNDVAAGPTTRQIYKVALASIVGSVIEQHDFLVTGIIAATLWGGVFFKLPDLARHCRRDQRLRPRHRYSAGRSIPLRPHCRSAWAQRRDGLRAGPDGHRLIGLTPSYDSIGVIAPLLLIVFRLFQGISFGAEFGTASTWVVEQAA